MKNIFNVRALLLVATVMLLGACGDEEVKIEPVEPKPDPPIGVKPDPEHDLYLTYSENVDGIWKSVVVMPDGTAISLFDGKRDVQTIGMHVDKDRNVYVVGSQDDSQRRTYPVVWKNQVPMMLTDTTKGEYGVPLHVRMHGDDMYIAGFGFMDGHTRAAYWKNGKIVFLHGTSLQDGFNSHLLDVFVDGNDVYAVGAIKNAEGKYEAHYWKNNVATKLKGTYAHSILVKDKSIYITGDFGSGKYWKDGAYLSADSGADVKNEKTPVYMKIFGDDFYMAGIGEYWKNGESVTIATDKIIPAVMDFYVYGDDVYFSGYTHHDDFNAPCYWKNGVLTLVTDAKHHGAVTAIFATAKQK